MFWKRRQPKNIRRSFLLEQLLKRKGDLPRAILKQQKGLCTPLRLSRFWLKMQKWILGLLALLLFGGLIYFSFFSESLNLHEVVFLERGKGKTATPSFSTIFDQLQNRRLFLINTVELRKEILERYPLEIQSITIRRRLPSKLVVHYEPYPEAFNLVVREKDLERKFLINSLGLVVGLDNENPELPTIQGPFQEFPKLKTLLFEPQDVQSIVRSVTLFTDKFGMKVHLVLYKKREREIHLKTERDFFIWMDLTQNVERQLFKLKRTLPKLDIYHEPIQYIDLRISGQTGDKVIFRRRG